MSLPNPSMSFTPFDILTASEMNDLVENIESLSLGTGLENGAVTPQKRAGGFYGIDFDFGAGTGSVSLTGVPFAPKALIHIGTTSNANNALFLSSGIAVADGNYQTLVGGAATGASAGSAQANNGVFARIDNNGNVIFRAVVTSWNNDGITVNKTTGSTTAANRTFKILLMG